MADYRYIQDRRTGTKHRISGVVDNTLTEEGIAAEAKAVGDSLATKAEVDGSYDSMTVGNAEQLISSVYEEDSVPYQFRTSGGSIDIGDREEDTVIGGTVAWNQLVQNGNFASTTNWTANNATLTTENNIGVLRASAQNGRIQSFLPIVTGHRYYIACSVKISSGTAYLSFRTKSKATTQNGVFERLEIIDSGDITSNVYFPRISDNRDSAWDDVQVKDVVVIDLTQLFGSTIADYIYSLEQTTAGAGVAWFRKLFPKDYYAFNPGELLSVSDLQSHDMVGFNAFNGTVNVGYRWNSGEYISAPSNYHSASPTLFKIIPNMTYCVSLPNSGSNQLFFYLQEFDSNKNWLRARNYVGISTTTKYATITVSPDAMYGALYFSCNTAAITTTDVSLVNVNLHWDGERDGEYEPYKKWSYPLDDSLTLRGIPKLDSANELYYDGDVYESDGTVTRRYGVVDLGTLTYVKDTAVTGIDRYSVALLGVKSVSGAYTVCNSICAKFTVTSIGEANTGVTGVFAIFGTTAYFYTATGAYSDAATFKTAMSGVYLVYELAEPTTESADSYQNPQIVDDFGTEEYVTTSIVPVGHETKYRPNLRAKLEMAPNSPDGNGDYIVRHTNGENVYVPLAFPAHELPPAPTEDGTYSMTVTVSNGTPTYAWASV